MECSNTRCKRQSKPGRKLCESCTKSNSESKKRQNAILKDQGLCITCRKPASLLRCSLCSIKNSMRKLLGSNQLVPQLLSKFDQQNCRCAYTGLPIVIGESASVDHKTPTSRGGTNDLDNLHWVHSSVNRMKGTMNHDEFTVFLAQLRESLNSSFQ